MHICLCCLRFVLNVLCPNYWFFYCTEGGDEIANTVLIYGFLRTSELVHTALLFKFVSITFYTMVGCHVATNFPSASDSPPFL